MLLAKRSEETSPPSSEVAAGVRADLAGVGWRRTRAWWGRTCGDGSGRWGEAWQQLDPTALGGGARARGGGGPAARSQGRETGAAANAIGGRLDLAHGIETEPFFLTGRWHNIIILSCSALC